jgi:alpha-1,2-mannosyltransferase
MNLLAVTIVLAVLLALGPLSLVLLFPKVIAYAAQTVGWYLRRKTAGRRGLIFQRTQIDEKAFLEKSRKDSDEEWENVEAYAAGSAKDKADDWDGVVGFFHPFW